MRNLTTLPKGHLHLHLEGAMRPKTLEELGARYGVPIPDVRHFDDFTAFAATYEAACEVLRTWDDLRRLVREVVEDAAASGVAWLEAGCRPTLHRPRLSRHLGEILEVILDEGAAAGAELGVHVGVLMTVDRSQPVEIAMEEADLAVAYADRGVVSFGLANDEALGPPERYAEPFRVARGSGLLSAPHAGELAGPASVWGALEALGADRVQHGVRAVEDAELVKRLADAQVCLDVCPTSNVLLKIVPSLEAHPLPQLLEAGIPCSLNGDDPLFFNASLAEEYELCRRAFGFDDPTLAGIARASIDHSGAPAEVKAVAGAGIDAWLAAPPGTT